MYGDSLDMRHALGSSACIGNKYIINDILGIGGFGITYIGKNITTNTYVAIKEYFPAGLAVRTRQQDTFSLCPVSGKKEELFLHGRQRFLEEAGILKEFCHLESIVSVYDVFEENNTAYIVMEYIEGLTLKQYIEENGCLCFTKLLSLMTPVIQDLSAIHKKKLIHRDISPDNLVIGTENRLHLIDFGAARHEDIAGGRHTVILKSGYAPPEQYIPGSKAGAWIDVYAVCATMYFALVGKPPYESIQRLEHDSLTFPDTLEDILPWQKSALEKGLDIRMARRFCSMEELYDALTIPPRTETQATITEFSLDRKKKQKIRRMHYHMKVPLLFFMLLFIPACVFFATYIVKSRQTPSVKTVYVTATPAPAVPSPEATILPSAMPMPGLYGLTLEKAKKTLKKLDKDVKIKTAYTYNNKLEKGHVISQNIDKGISFSDGHFPVILLTISLGKKPPETSPSPKVIKTTEPQKTPKPVLPSKPMVSPKPGNTKKKTSPGYKIVPEDDGFVTIPLG